MRDRKMPIHQPGVGQMKFYYGGAGATEDYIGQSAAVRSDDYACFPERRNLISERHVFQIYLTEIRKLLCEASDKNLLVRYCSHDALASGNIDNTRSPIVHLGSATVRDPQSIHDPLLICNPPVLDTRGDYHFVQMVNAILDKLVALRVGTNSIHRAVMDLTRYTVKETGRTRQ